MLQVKLESLVGEPSSILSSASGLTAQGLTRALASEVGREGIRVNVIVPGYVESDMTAGKFTSLGRMLCDGCSAFISCPLF